MCAFSKISCLPKETQKEWSETLWPSSFFQLSGWVSHSYSLRPVHERMEQPGVLRPLPLHGGCPDGNIIVVEVVWSSPISLPLLPLCYIAPNFRDSQ